MKKLLLLLLLFCLLFSAASCSPEQPDLPSESSSGEETLVSTPYVDPVLQAMSTTFEIYGDYIYTLSSEDGLIRYHLETMERSSACTDPTCDGTCLIENPKRREIWDLAGIVDGNLYFMVYDGIPNPSEFVYARIDLVTGKVTEIYRQPASNDPMQRPLVSNGYLYYLQYALKDGGEPKNPEDYDLYYCRVSIDGGESEVFCPAEKDGGFRYIHFAVGDLLYMYSDYQYIAYDIKTGEEHVLHETSEYCHTYSYYDGKIYYIQIDDTPTIDTDYRLGYLYSLDVNTGEAKRLVDEYISRFQVTKDGIYYVLFDERSIYTPRDPEKKPEIVDRGAETYFCKHDGTKKTTVFHSENLNLWFSATVIDGKYYGYISEFKVTEAERIEDDRFFWDSLGYCILDFKTGEITPWDTKE